MSADGFRLSLRNSACVLSVGPHIIGYVAARGFKNNFGPPSGLVEDE